MPASTPYRGREPSICGLPLLASGKVRDVYEVDAKRLLFVTSDRISAFDVVMGELAPFKGAVLTAIAAHWFARTRDIVPNHLLSTSVDDVPGLDASWRERLRGRIMLVQRAKPTTVEWVVRGYLAGSGWKEYQRSRSVCGVPLPDGLQLASRLPEPILTPTTKDSAHDLPLTAEQAAERVGRELFESARRACFELFARASVDLAARGVILADTKFEFGVADGRMLLIDEALTPDSSRLWPAAQWRAGSNPPSLDKQGLRDWLEAQPWDKNPPAPSLPPSVVGDLQRRYLEVCELLTGRLPEGVSRAEVLA